MKFFYYMNESYYDNKNGWNIENCVKDGDVSVKEIIWCGWMRY